MFELDKMYRDKIKGVIGKAVAQGTHEERDGTTTPALQLELLREHLDDTPNVAKAHQLRWYPVSRLEEVNDSESL